MIIFLDFLGWFFSQWFTQWEISSWAICICQWSHALGCLQSEWQRISTFCFGVQFGWWRIPWNIVATRISSYLWIWVLLPYIGMFPYMVIPSPIFMKSLILVKMGMIVIISFYGWWKSMVLHHCGHNILLMMENSERSYQGQYVLGGMGTLYSYQVKDNLSLGIVRAKSLKILGWLDITILLLILLLRV